MGMVNTAIQWRFRHFDLFSAREWHTMLALRTSIFVVEQGCPYQEADHKDPLSWHLEGILDGQLIAGMRLVPPGVSYDEASIGRVVVMPEYRREGLGGQLMVRGIAASKALWPGSIRISGQGYLEDFYKTLGFVTVRGPYLEDDIPHFEMLLP